MPNFLQSSASMALCLSDRRKLVDFFIGIIVPHNELRVKETACPH
jgi:hypothetical protein